MKTRTFTMLVSITDDEIPDVAEIAARIAELLEVGHVQMNKPYSAATVSAMEGDQTACNLRTLDARNLHTHLRRN